MLLTSVRFKLPQTAAAVVVASTERILLIGTQQTAKFFLCGCWSVDLPTT